MCMKKKIKKIGVAMAVFTTLVVSSAENAFAAGWVLNGVGWWYDAGNGTYPAGNWYKVGDIWYYFDSNGYMRTGWVKDHDIWYYCDNSGAMVTGWHEVDGLWYFFGQDGHMLTGWVEDKDKWYYLSADGAMSIGWNKINNTDYYFYESGEMAKNQWLDGGWIGDDGAWNASNSSAQASKKTKKSSSDESNREKNTKLKYETEGQENIYKEDQSNLKDEGVNKDASSEKRAEENQIPVSEGETKKEDRDENVAAKEENKVLKDIDDSNKVANTDMKEQKNQEVESPEKQISFNHQKPESTLTFLNFQSLEPTYELGTTVQLKGEISSNYDITLVEIELIEQYLGQNRYYIDISPNSKKFNMDEVDWTTLDTKQIVNTGASYKFEITATDSSGATKTFETDLFSMEITKNVEIVIDGLIEPPETIVPGEKLEIAGIIRTNYPISSVFIKLQDTKNGNEIIRDQLRPYTLEFDLEKEFAKLFNELSLEKDPYRLQIEIKAGNRNKEVIDTRFSVEEEKESVITFRGINTTFIEYDDGTKKVTNGSRPFEERIVEDSPERVSRKYARLRPYICLSYKRNSTDPRTNEVYAHSSGTVTLSDKNAGTVIIKHPNGMQTKYSNMDKENIYVYKGVKVDEKTTLGVIKNNSYVQVELINQNGEQIDIEPYLKTQLP